MNLAPRSFRARATWVMTLTWVETGLVPQAMMRSLSAISRASTPRMMPTPAIQPESDKATQMVLFCREYFFSCRKRSIPSRWTSPMVPA